MQKNINFESSSSEVIAFLDEVFFDSKVSFRNLLPKVYGNLDCYPKNHFVIRSNEGVISGCILAETVQFVVDGKPIKIGLIGSVAVRKTCRGQGLMTILMSHTQDHFKKEQCDATYLLGNEALYRKYGFSDYGIKSKYILKTPDTEDRSVSWMEYDKEKDLLKSPFWDAFKSQALRPSKNYSRDELILSKTVLSWGQRVLFCHLGDSYIGYAILKKKKSEDLELCVELNLPDLFYGLLLSRLKQVLNISDLFFELPGNYQDLYRDRGLVWLESQSLAKCLISEEGKSKDITACYLYSSDFV